MALSIKKFKGIATALITPFNDNGGVDLDSFGKLLKQQYGGGVKHFIINGTTAESPNLEFNEVKKLFNYAKENLRSDVVLTVGTGSNSTAKTIETTNKAAALGAHAALVVVPYYNKPTQAGIVAHFTAVAESSDIPIILYNVPGRTIAKLEPETIALLSKHKNIIGIKDATGDISHFLETKKLVSFDFIFLSGDDGTCVEFFEKGGDGVISVVSHLMPKVLVDFYSRAKQDGSGKESESFHCYNELLDFLYCEPNPTPAKMALYKMGIIGTPNLRLPLLPMTPEKTEGFIKCLKTLELL